MNPLTPMIKQWYEPPAVSSFHDFVFGVAWLVLPWILLFWILAVVIHIMFPANRTRFGAQAAVRLSYAWAGFWIGAILLVDVLVLLVLGHIPGWTSVAPHATLIFLGALLAFLFWYGLRQELRLSQVPLRKAQQGARA